MSSLFDFFSKIEKEIIDERVPNHASYVFSYSDSSEAITIGNFLRRILLSTTRVSSSGIGIFAAEILGESGYAETELATLEGICEAVFQLILNLKEILFEEKKCEEGEIFVLELMVENKKNEEKKVFAGDFLESPNVRIKNPDLELATLAAVLNDKKKPKLGIKLHCRKSRGYRKNENDIEIKNYLEELKNEEKKVIVLEKTSYSPIKSGQVALNYQKKTISLTEQKERLVLTITTKERDVSPRDALQATLEIAQN